MSNDSNEPLEQEMSTAVNTVLGEAAMDHMDSLRERILFSLSVYQSISTSMLHVALGTSTSAALFRPIVQQLISEGLVIEEQIPLTAPTGRLQTYSVLHLASNPYIPPASSDTAQSN